MDLRELALVLFTVIMQMAVGAFCVLGGVHFFAARRNGLDEADKLSDRALVAIGPLAVFALAVTFLHLGNPVNAPRAISNLGTSWLSREITLALLFSVGGAVYGNAGAFGGDVAHDLIHAEVLTEGGLETWSVEKFGYGYRTSVLKRGDVRGIVISAQFGLKNAVKEEVSATIEHFSARRKATQPPGASMGSMFKNPEGDYAGRLIEAAGLKGTRIGNAEISPIHGNFFINHGETRAADIRALIELAQKTVHEKFGVNLELEVELIGEW